jgi:hypothetical protein
MTEADVNYGGDTGFPEEIVVVLLLTSRMYKGKASVST